MKNVKWARFEDTNSNLIKELYANDTGVGWILETEDGQRKPMSEDIQTEILIPIYSRFFEERFGSSDAIIGIANFEWDELFQDWKIKEIGRFLAYQIQEKNCFDLNDFVCSVLPNITFLDDN